MDERQKYEKSPAFKKGQRFRAGIEGTISVLFRGRSFGVDLDEELPRPLSRLGTLRALG
jgi:hypothetical protein